MDCSGFASLLIGKALQTPYVSFADNLFNEDTLMASTLSGRYGCRDTACSVYGSYYQDWKGTTFRPRTVGVTATYRY